MQASQFLEVYPKNLPERLLHQPLQDVDVSASRQWSAEFGYLAHNALGGEVIDSGDYEKIARPYLHWSDTDRVVLVQDVLENHEQALSHVRNEFTFHDLNVAMIHLWLPVVAGDKVWRNDNARRAFISGVQDRIALHGFMYYAHRQRFAGRLTDYAYFAANNSEVRGSIEGAANEFDAALVALEVMKRRRALNVLPAPIQFESYSARSGADRSSNVDLLCIEDGNAVGIQVKTKVLPSDEASYDKRRVVLFDGSNDMGNERTLRTASNSTKTRLVSWAGLLCAQRLMDISTTAKRQEPLPFDRPTIMKLKLLARQSGVQQFKPYLGKAADVLDQKLTASFAVTT